MKKVISALTAAVMTASASASVLSAFAAYTSPSDLGFYLKVTSTGDYTVSDDGKTITFATKEAAAGATFTVGHYIVADTASPSIQQINGMVSLSSPALQIAETPFQNLDNAGVTTTVSNPALGTAFETTAFVNTFGFYDDIMEEFNNATGNMDTQTIQEGDKLYAGKDSLAWTWLYNFGGSEEYSDYKETAHFLTNKSDEYPIEQFNITMASDVADGTYTIDWETSFTNDFGENPATFVNTDGKTQIHPGTLDGLTIIVGDPNAQPSETTEPTTEEQQPTETTEEQQPSETTEPTEPTEEKTHDKYEWEIGDVIYDPENDKTISVPIKVWNSEPMSGYSLGLLVDGLTLRSEDFPFSNVRFKDEKAFPTQATFMPNTDDLTIAAAADANLDNPDSTVKNGATIVTVIFVPKADYTYTPGQKFVVAFSDEKDANLFGNNADQQLTPVLTNGSITVKGGEETTDPTTEPTEPSSEETETTPEPTETTSEEQPTETTEQQPTETGEQPTQPFGDYIYGDVNHNGTVELVDIVMLNRYLTKYDNQDLDDYQVVVANCYRNGESDADTTKANLDGKDSVEILRFLIGLVASLPTQG